MHRSRIKYPSPVLSTSCGVNLSSDRASVVCSGCWRLGQRAFPGPPTRPFGHIGDSGIEDGAPSIHVIVIDFGLSREFGQECFAKGVEVFRQQTEGLVVGPNEFRPGGRTSALGCGRYTVATQHIADCLIGDMISQIGEAPTIRS